MPKHLYYIDLFAGCGGLSLGLHQAGLKGLFAVERSSDAFQTLKHNLIDNKNHFDWPDWLRKKSWNINNVIRHKKKHLNDLKGEVDLIVGGPPCQGFSTAGSRKSYDSRNQLIHSYLSFVSLVQPSVVMFENVKGFTVKFSKSRKKIKKAYSEIVLSKLHDLGYTDAYGILLSLDNYGVPQRRERFIIIATRNKSSKKIFDHLENGIDSFLKEQNLARTYSSSDALSDLEYQHGTIDCPDTKNFKSGLLSVPQTNLQKYLRKPDLETYVPDSHRFVNHTKPVIGVFEKLLEKAPRNKRINGDERAKYGVKKRNVTVLDPAQPSLTITTIPDDFVHYSEPRVMTVRESARLQTFPDWYEFKGPYTTGGKRRAKQTPRYTQVGNAVPPLFAQQLGIAIKNVINHE